MARKQIVRLKRAVIVATLAIFIAIPFASSPAYAASTQITGGTYGPNCGSGGYFMPSSVTITSGNTVTISVPSNDPYSGGIQVHGFPEGNFTVLPGSSHTTAGLTDNVSYYGTWPNTGCMKGTGTITVSVPTPPPSPSPTPSPSPSPSGGGTKKTTHTSMPSSTSSSSNPKSGTTVSGANGSTKSSKTTSKKTVIPSNASPSSNMTSTTPRAQTGSPAQPVAATVSKTATAGARAGYKVVGASSAALAAVIAGWLLWRFGPGRNMVKRLIQLIQKEHKHNE